MSEPDMPSTCCGRGGFLRSVGAAGFADARSVVPSIDFDDSDTAREVECVPVDFNDGFDW